ncbi:hypothetical protein ACIBBD_25290 [Streptomyces sp. NPDC051315]|uniref:hypothetical protein n=1 Tax=Streptomyces sp. NPDC051315 TaxID=3365650 RepID=UPI0037AEB8AE
MNRRRSGLRLTAVLALVVLALTGFSTGSSSKSGSGKSGSGSSSGSGGGSGGGGGCSSSSQDHDDTDDGSDGTGGSAENVKDAEVTLVSCATEADAYATVEVTNPNSYGAYFTVTVRFLDADSQEVDLRTADEFVAANETRRVRVALAHPGLAADVDHCEPEPYAAAD